MRVQNDMGEKVNVIKAKGGSWYFIFPFLFDPTVFEQSDWIKSLESQQCGIKFKKGLHESRKGYLPILPYKSLHTNVLHWQELWGKEKLIRFPKKAQDAEMQDSQIGNFREYINVSLTETGSIHSSGIGVLTYEITPDLTELGENEFIIMSRLIPRTYGWKQIKAERNQSEKDSLKKTGQVEEGQNRYYEIDPYYWAINDEMLSMKADKRIMEIGRAITSQLKFKNGKGIKDFFEEATVYDLEYGIEDSNGQREEFRQPYVVINLEIDHTLFEDAIRKYWLAKERKESIDQREKNSIYHQIVNLVYRFWAKAKVAPGLLGYRGDSAPIKILALNVNIISFVSSYTTLNIYCKGYTDHSDLFTRDFNLPTLCSTIEIAVCQFYFALTLDALLDTLMRDIASAKNLKLIEELRIKLDKYRKQAGLMLEDISQYVRAGLLGTEMTIVLKEVFQSRDLGDRVLKKIDLAANLMESRGWTVRFSGRDEALSNAKKDFLEAIKS